MQDDDHSPVPSIAEIRAHQADNSLDSTRLQDLRKYAAEDDEYQQASQTPASNTGRYAIV